MKRLRRQQEDEVETSKARFVERYQHSEAGKNCTLVDGDQQREKMSDRLVELARPLLRDGDTIDNTRKALGLAALAWNLSLLPERARQAESSKLASQLTPEIMPFLEDLVQDKLDSFPEVNRLIMNYEVIPLGDSFHVNVISSVPKPDRARP